MDLTYDSAGNVTSTKLWGTGSAYMQSSAEYTDSNTKLESQTDSAGYTTYFEYLTERGLLRKQSGANAAGGETETVYDYNSSDRLSMAYINGVISAEYFYIKGR